MLPGQRFCGYFPVWALMELSKPHALFCLGPYGALQTHEVYNPHRFGVYLWVRVLGPIALDPIALGPDLGLGFVFLFTYSLLVTSFPGILG